MSGQQTSKVFSSGFMVGQLEQETGSGLSQDKIDTHGYDMVGNAQMASVLQVGYNYRRLLATTQSFLKRD